MVSDAFLQIKDIVVEQATAAFQALATKVMPAINYAAGRALAFASVRLEIQRVLGSL